MATPLPPHVELRPVTSADLEFLFQVYASSRDEERELVGWDEAAWEHFLRQQFDFQHAQYQRNYDHPAFDLIVVDGRPAGRLYVNRQAGDIRVVDIALLRDYRRLGVGGGLLQRLIDEAEREQAGISLHVERSNPILAYYRRLGFQVEADRGVYLFMIRPPMAMAAGQP